MTLIDKVSSDLKQAMVNKDQASMRSLRAIKSAIMLAQTEKRASRELSPEKELQLLQKFVKQRRDSLEIYQEQNREDLAKIEIEEATIIETYLPEQMSLEELKSEITSIITEVGATDMKDMGKIMGMASKKFAGKADNKMISQIVREVLS